MYPLHQYIERHTGRIVTEHPVADRLVRLIYAPVREHAPMLFRLLTSPRASALLAWMYYDRPLMPPGRVGRMAHAAGIDLAECVDRLEALRSPRALFERRIRYELCRPMPAREEAVVAPADARCSLGSFADTSMLFLKEKFFSREELWGGVGAWASVFREGDFAVFRLTPEKYHYNHMPVSGVVVACYEVDGANHSCNPSALVELATAYSKNRRVITVIDTDVEGGSGVGYVAMIEITALMIGGIVSCYSEQGYMHARPLALGQFVRRGQPKSLYRPGSSVDVLVFEAGRIRWAADLAAAARRTDVCSRYTCAFGRPLVETDVRVRSLLAWRASASTHTKEVES
jgi:phosphatidylserine decarboxylase